MILSLRGAEAASEAWRAATACPEIAEGKQSPDCEWGDRFASLRSARDDEACHCEERSDEAISNMA